jgi:hypothetical protein
MPERAVHQLMNRESIDIVDSSRLANADPLLGGASGRFVSDSECDPGLVHRLRSRESQAKAVAPHVDGNAGGGNASNTLTRTDHRQTNVGDVHLQAGIHVRRLVHLHHGNPRTTNACGGRGALVIIGPLKQ